ncbi:IS110 family transposase [Chloroflexi bacterium TSY]|nr:IS110 family transposase [Chloroflexi bacterium TSY]
MKVKMGIDWSEKKHDVMMLDETGRALGYAQIEHSQKGFRQIEEMRKKTGASHDEVTVGLETAHNLLIDYLWSSGYKNVYVVPPNVVNKSRERYSQSGAHNDKSDAYVIADLLRTDVHRFYPWSPGSELLQQMRVVSSATQYWTKETVALSNRLRACLLRYHPALLEVFSNWPSRIACHLVLTYPTPEHVRNSTYEGFQEFLKQHRHTQPRKWVTCYDKLTATYPTSAPAFVPAYQREALQLAECLLLALRYEQETLDQLQSLFSATSGSAYLCFFTWCWPAFSSQSSGQVWRRQETLSLSHEPSVSGGNLSCHQTKWQSQNRSFPQSLRSRLSLFYSAICSLLPQRVFLGRCFLHRRSPTRSQKESC